MKPQPSAPANVRMLYPEECYAVRGALLDVYSHLGVGFVESVYQAAVEMELADRGIPFESQKSLPVLYKGRPLNQTFRADIVCYGKIILELKAVHAVLPEHEAQIFNYLRITGLRLGLLVNFTSYPKLFIKQFVI